MCTPKDSFKVPELYLFSCVQILKNKFKLNKLLSLNWALIVSIILLFFKFSVVSTKRKKFF